MTFAEKAKFFEDNKVRSTDVITCEVMTNNYGIGNKDDFKNWTLSNETFEIIAKYVCDWISETAIDLELAIYVFDGLMKGLRSNTFTIQDVDHDEPVVRNFINALI